MFSREQGVKTDGGPDAAVPPKMWVAQMEMTGQVGYRKGSDAQPLRLCQESLGLWEEVDVAVGVHPPTHTPAFPRTFGLPLSSTQVRSSPSVVCTRRA
ncbi:hypothetical protein GCM10025871_06800 [Deinococcus metallilatus]|nr:hypothetical protein GCM10025871_06800 [Deinococcus metallilatus]